MDNLQIIDQLLQTDLTNYINLRDLLAMSKEIHGDDAEMSKLIMQKVRDIAIAQCMEGRDNFYTLYNDSLQLMASEHKDFDSFLLYVEKDREPHESFYIPRRKQLLDYVVKPMQRLLDGEIDILSISMPPGTGKGQLPSAKILTPDGFRRLGDIRVGDFVISGTGNVAEVLGVFPKPRMPVYEVVFEDGTKVKCSQDHIWHVQNRDGRKHGWYQNVEVKDMLDRVVIDRHLNYSVDYVPPIDIQDKELPIDPYVLGVLLADNKYGVGIRVTTADKYIIDTITNLAPITARHVIGNDYRVVSDGWLERELTKYGLFRISNQDKFIPDDYRYNTYYNRFELLRGLLDMDGVIDGDSVKYQAPSKRFASYLIEMVQSVGGYAKEENDLEITIKFGDVEHNPFHVPHKADGFLPSMDRKLWKRRIRRIEYVGDMETICIYINDPSHLYITDGYVITHNTTLGEFFTAFYMGLYPERYNLMSSHSGFMTRMFYDAVLNIITSSEYRWSDIFPTVKFESTNAKEESINLGKWKPFKSLTCRPIHASLTGVTRCNGLLYCDDLVSGIEEALSIDRLNKLYGEYVTDLKSRKKQGAAELHIATRWSVHDPIGRLQRQYDNSGNAEFVSVPDIDVHTGESNFDYSYGTGFDTAYFNDMEKTMDDVTYRCLYKNDPIEREGILYHPNELFRYFDLPVDDEGKTKEPDAIIAVCDTKDTGTDYNSLPVVYVYGDKYYLEDIVFKNIDPGTLDELNSNMLVKHRVQEARFESNKEGSRTANEVERKVKEKGGRCHITKKYTTQNKETKIIVTSSWVKQHVYFKDETCYEPKSDYGVFMSYLCSYTQLGKNKHDDAPDSMAMLAQFADNLIGTAMVVMSREELGF